MTANDIMMAKSGSEDMIEKIFLKYKSYISKKSQSFYIKGGDIEDLQQEGYIGLLKAIKYFDCSKDVNFNSFAYLCIKRQMLTAIRNSNTAKNQGLNEAVTQEDGVENFLYTSEKSLELYTPEEITLGKELLSSLNKFLEIKLTPLEKRVATYLLNEYKYIEIAEKLNEEPKKIDNCIQRIKRKVCIFLKKYNTN
ncbi:sigma-70 family RNA polymerase sigma factor [Fusobacterium sp.]|uniref:sigma-70 family RNA polymerase sigma factor n=1 Tax=Fusobacterium sp. TaxID=68766 RepID=UPI0026255303|nr:sigma-70 family RNA polymerase sigma factor [Fusobacterium sp.]